MLQNKIGEIRELLRLGSNVGGGVGFSSGGFSGFDWDSGGEGRVSSGVVRFSSSAIEGVSGFFSSPTFFLSFSFAFCL